jgi:hypothetical protein
MDESKSGIDLHSTAIVLLIAVVSIVGAIVTWRVSIALSDAGTADTLGILAVVEKEDVTTRYGAKWQKMRKERALWSSCWATIAEFSLELSC